MTIVGNGGLKITTYSYTKRFQKDFKKLDPAIKAKAEAKIRQLTQSPFPPGLRFEKLKGYSKPDIYTVHVTGNFKISLEIVSGHATLRRVAVHNTIDATP